MPSGLRPRSSYHYRPAVVHDVKSVGFRELKPENWSVVLQAHQVTHVDREVRPDTISVIDGKVEFGPSLTLSEFRGQWRLIATTTPIGEVSVDHEGRLTITGLENVFAGNLTSRGVHLVASYAFGSVKSLGFDLVPKAEMGELIAQ